MSQNTLVNQNMMCMYVHSKRSLGVTIAGAAHRGCNTPTLQDPLAEPESAISQCSKGAKNAAFHGNIPIAGWFMLVYFMENPTKMDDLRVPLF